MHLLRWSAFPGLLASATPDMPATSRVDAVIRIILVAYHAVPAG